jgi:hypothetical protein
VLVNVSIRKSVNMMPKNKVIGSARIEVTATNHRIKGISHKVPRAGYCLFAYKTRRPPIRHNRLYIAKLIPKGCFQKSRSNSQPRAMPVTQSRFECLFIDYLLEQFHRSIAEPTLRSLSKPIIILHK